MEDKLLEKFFEPERWQDALNKSSMKGINIQFQKMKVTGNITYSLSFSYDMDEEIFKDPECNDTGIVNDWILDTVENNIGIDYNIRRQIEGSIKKNAPKDTIISIMRDDVIVHDLADKVKYIRDKYNIPE